MCCLTSEPTCLPTRAYNLLCSFWIDFGFTSRESILIGSRILDAIRWFNFTSKVRNLIGLWQLV